MVAHRQGTPHVAWGFGVKEQFAFTPFRMKREAAAFYCGMSPSAFDRAVAAKALPEGKNETGGKFWLRSDLEAAMVEGAPIEHDFGQAI